MITPRMYQVEYDASLRTVLSNFRFTLWGPAPHHSLKNWIFFWLPARWASGFSGDHQQDHQCLWLLLCYSIVLSFIVCILLGIKLLLLLQYYVYIQWEYWSTMEKIKHYLRYENKVNENKVLYCKVLRCETNQKQQKVVSLYVKLTNQQIL